MSHVDDQAELDARNRAMREHVDRLMADLEQHTSVLRQARDQAIAAVGRASSLDGQVTVTVDAGGMPTDIAFAPSVFTRNTPDKLAATLLRTIRAAAADARGQAGAALEPTRQGLPDLPDLFADAPALRDLLPAPLPPPPPSEPTLGGWATQAVRPSTPAPRRRPPEPVHDDDEGLGPIMERNYP